MVQRFTLPILWTPKDVSQLEYPNDLCIGMYVWDNTLRQAVLITNSDSVEIHQHSINTASRNRFATHEEIRATREKEKHPYVVYNTVSEFRAYILASSIYFI